VEDVEDKVSCFVDVEDESDVADEAVVDTVIEEVSADVEAVLKSEASVIIAGSTVLTILWVLFPQPEMQKIISVQTIKNSILTLILINFLSVSFYLK
jgi:hypothetical protein